MRRPIAPLVLAFFAAGLALEPAAACSVCLAGDPVFEATGTTVGETGQWNLFVQGSFWSKKSGLLEHEAHPEGGEEAHGEHEERAPYERNRSGRLDLALSYTPLDRLTVTLNLPFAFNRISEVEHESESFSLSGLGDVSLLSSVVLWRNRAVLPSTWVEGRAFVEAPTGESHRSDKGGRDPHLQPGSGSWDFGLGAAAAHRLARASLYASASYRLNSEGSLDYEYGDHVLVNLALLAPLADLLGAPELTPLSAGFELNFRWAERDEHRGEPYAHSGGAILYATPSLRVAIPRLAIGERIPPSLRLAVQVPLTNAWLRGWQEEGLTWRAGLLLPF